jgi:hypothetical protein
MLSTKDDKILNLETVIRILSRPSVHQKYPNLKPYYYKITKHIKNNYIYINVKNEYKNKLDVIASNIENLFSTQVQLTGDGGSNITVSREPPRNQIYNIILVLKARRTTIKILFPFLTKSIVGSGVLAPGAPNEFMLEALVKSQLDFIEEQVKDVKKLFPTNFSPVLSVFIYEGSKTTPSVIIGPIKKIERVGDVRDKEGYQIKPDIKITTNFKVVNISVKMEVFPQWSSAGRYTGAKVIMDYLTNNNIITVNGTMGSRSITYNNSNYSGIVLPATPGEIKKFCFNNDEVKYIINKTFSNDDIISEVSQYGSSLSSFKMDLRVNSIYENNSVGIDKLKPNVFLVINAKNTTASGLTTKYDGFSVNFVPKNKIPKGAVSIPVPTNLSGRL